jgi:DNA-binding transcriptional MerR regulator
MSNYSIRDLEQLSGIKAHTLRIWEQRYQIIKPDRSDTNIRNYNSENLKLILNVAVLRDHGYKISKIAKLSNQEIQREVVHLSDQQLNFPDQIQALTTSMLELDEIRFEHILTVNVKKFGFEAVMLNIIYPFLAKIGTLWITGSIGPVQEHFMSSLIRQKLFVAIDGLESTPAPNHKTFVLYLPEGEYHEIGLLFAYYIIKSKKHKVIYLGQSLPKADLEFVCNMHKPDFIFTAITSVPSADFIQKYLDWLSNKFSNINVLITGYQTTSQNLSLAKNIKVINQVKDFYAFLS